jgi:peroxiredoxin
MVRFFSVLTLLSVLAPAVSLGAPERVGDFALLDDDGEYHQLSRYLHKKALVVMAYAATCADMASHTERFSALHLEWEAQDIEFVLIDSLGSSRQAIRQIATPLPVLEDNGQLVSESLNLSNAGEVLVLNPERSSLLYRGPVSDALEQVLGQVAEGATQDTVNVNLQDCSLEYPVQLQHQQQLPDYANDVAPIIIDNCAECHRVDGVGPFAIDSHIMLMGWSPMIREVLLNRRMPPTQVDPEIGHSPNARYLSAEDMQTLIHWIDAGAPRGDSEGDPLEMLDFSDRKQWQLGEPDYIVTGPANEIAPTGVMDYIYVDVELPFEEDRWVKAVQYLAGDESVLHHLMTYVTAQGENFWGPERDQLSVTRRFLEGYAPGAITAVEFPANTAVHIPAGHKLSMQFHYVTNGRATVDETQLGLYFLDSPAPHEKLTQVVSARFVIPPNEHNFELQAEHVFDEDVIITGLRAHMHFRGKDMKFSIQPPGEDIRPLLSIPAYNYGWQPHYLLSDPAVLKAGTKVIVTGAFDNSRSNPSNPDPDKQVGFGVDSWDEMFSGYLTFHGVE